MEVKKYIYIGERGVVVPKQKSDDKGETGDDITQGTGDSGRSVGQTGIIEVKVNGGAKG